MKNTLPDTLPQAAQQQRIEPVARTVKQFCGANQISHVHFYALLKRGLGPRVMKVGRRVLITLHAEAEWHRRMEAASQGDAA